jgi:hypothetical protein
VVLRVIRRRPKICHPLKPAQLEPVEPFVADVGGGDAPQQLKRLV